MRLAFRLLQFVSSILFVSVCFGLPVTFEWDPNIETDLAGYRLYWGIGSGEYTQSIDVGNVTTYTLNLNESSYIVATAYDTDNNESEYSNEVYWQRDGELLPATGLWNTEECSPTATTWEFKP